MAHAGGRPRAFKSVEDIEAKIQLYKEYLKTESKPPTIAGLAYFLNVDRGTIYNYKKDREFFNTIKKYRDWVIMNMEEFGVTKGHSGIIFLMKNYGYTDKHEYKVEETTAPVVINDADEVAEWYRTHGTDEPYHR
jgi:hypothetical protein